MSRALADAEGGGGPLADAVHGEDGRLLEGGGQEARGGVAHVVLGEEDRPLVGLELLADDRGHPELLVEPHRHRLAEGVERAREGGDVGREHPLELQERLVVEADRVELLGPDARLVEHVLDRPVRGSRSRASCGRSAPPGRPRSRRRPSGGRRRSRGRSRRSRGRGSRERPSELVPGGALGAERVRLVRAPEGGLGGEPPVEGVVAEEAHHEADRADREDVDDREEDGRPDLADAPRRRRSSGRRRATSGRSAGRRARPGRRSRRRPATLKRQGRAANQATASGRLKWLTTPPDNSPSS